jgi:ubiquinone/menaquinone biosynthesis C-methylase UbiE
MKPGYLKDDLENLPPDAVAASAGCGNPTAIAGLKEGETVLDLGSGGGIDAFIAAERVGPKGKAIGVDMTPDMVALARNNQIESGLDNVEFRLGEIEHLPVADESVDVVISNCVINLSTDKDAVFKEAYRALRSGGRLVVSDIMAKGIPGEARENLAVWAGCIGGAISIEEYTSKIREAGFRDLKVVANTPYARELLDSLNVEDVFISHAEVQAYKP